MKQRVHVVMMWDWGYVPSGIPWAAAELANAFRATDFDPILYIPFKSHYLPPKLKVRGGLPKKWRTLFGEKRVQRWARARIERQVLRVVRRDGPGALVWLWPGCSTAFVRQLKAAGATLIREMVNTHRVIARRILKEETARTGLKSQHWITEEQVEEELAQLGAADLLVSPSISVDKSLVEAGVTEDRIIRSSFGWDPSTMEKSPSSLPGSGIKAVFVGTAGLRKGIHLALPAWRKAGVDGTFFVVGDIEPGVRATAEQYAGDDVVFLPFTDNLPGVYYGADFMFFPTLEEGAPLVVYQGAGCGLPIITTEMGTSRIIEDGKSGIIIDAHDENGMIAALRKLATDPALRASMGREAKLAADRATWAHAAQDRAAQVTARLGLA